MVQLLMSFILFNSVLMLMSEPVRESSPLRVDMQEKKKNNDNKSGECGVVHTGACQSVLDHTWQGTSLANFSGHESM